AADAGPPDLQLAPDRLKEWAEQAKRAKVVVVRSGDGIDVQFSPDVQSAVQSIVSFSAEVGKLGEDYWKKVQNVIDKFNSSSGGFKVVVRDGKVDIDTSVHEEGFSKIGQLNARYEEELKKLMERYGAAVTVGKDGRPVITFADPSKYGEFKAKFEALNKRYDEELGKILKEHGLKVEGNKIVIDTSIYSGVFSELDKINQRHNKGLEDMYSKYGNILGKKTDESGRTVYTLKPNAQSALEIYNLVADITNAYNAMLQQKVQDVVSKYSDVLSYDQTTGRIALSKGLEEMLNRYSQAVQEVNKLTNAMSTVAGMIPTFAQQLPTLNVQFMTYDADKKAFVPGGETPIYIKDPEKRKELLDWLKRQGTDPQGNPNVDTVAFVDPRHNLPVAYIYNKKTGEGYLINYMADQVQYLPDAKKYAEAHIESVWLSSLSPKELEQYIQSQQLEHLKQVSKKKFEELPPVVREIVGTLATAGQYVFVPDMLVLKGALLGDKDPLLEAKKFKAVVEGINEASPVTTYAGTALGIGTIVGGAAASILARGAAKLAAQGVKDVAKDVPKITAAGTVQPLQQTVKTPTLLQTAAAGLKDAAVPMAVSGAAFGGLEAAKSYLETGSVDVSRVLEGAAFGSLMGAFPITKTQALAALGIGAGATAGSHFIRGYDLTTSLAVGEAAGLTVVVGGGVKGLSDASVKTSRAPEVKTTDVDLSGIKFAKRLSSAVENVVDDVVSGRITVDEANLRLGAIRDVVRDKALFDEILQRYKKTLSEPPRGAPTLDFVSAAKKAAEVISAVESGKLPDYMAFTELANLRASVADKAKFDKQFGAKLKEYGEQYIQWLSNSGLSKQWIVLNLHRHEGVLGKQFIERHVPDYGRVLAEVKATLSQLRPVSPREAPVTKLTPDELHNRVENLFKDVLTGNKDFFKASEELYRLWNKLSPDMRAELEAILHDLNVYYGERFGITLEPWRPSLLESVLRRAELFATDVRSALAKAPKATAELIKSTVKSVEEFLSPRHIAEWWERLRFDVLTKELNYIADSFSRGRISLDEAKKSLVKLADKFESFGEEMMAKTIREKLNDDEALKRFLESAQRLHGESMLASALLAPRATVDLIKMAPKATAELIKSTVKSVEEFLSPRHIAEWWERLRFDVLTKE
ncbi:MAG: hypothetical protein ACO2PM_01640, partial [Pyrobaculum sp.]